MVNILTVFITGTAGSGKSTLTSALADYLESQDNYVGILNLDPAAEYLPYTPDIDIRDYVSAKGIMRKYKLGPNASLIAAVDLIITKVDELRQQISELDPTYLIVDTPGQLEMFAFRDTGPLIVNRLNMDKSMVIFVIDSVHARTMLGLASSLLLSLSVQLRIQKTQVNVLNKADLLTEEEIEEIENMIEEPDYLETRGDSELVTRIGGIIRSIGMIPKPIPVSAVKGQGLDRIHAIMEQVLTGGDKPS
ncbi:MAG: GTPase [Caldivirga sp.]|nr:GTPase [Caldivirga sp.]